MVSSMGWFTKWGCAATTLLISQLESLKVISAPLPGTFPVKFSITFKSWSPLQVTVKLSQLVS